MSGCKLRDAIGLKFSIEERGKIKKKTVEKSRTKKKWAKWQGWAYEASYRVYKAR